MPPPRPFWKGYLKLSLVSCPIALYTATSSSERVAFRQINKERATAFVSNLSMKRAASRSSPKTRGAATRSRRASTCRSRMKNLTPSQSRAADNDQYRSLRSQIRDR